jgi:hypothetical protein
MSAQRIGWGWPGAATKPHYFLDGSTSLCGKWMFTGEVDTPLDPGRPSDCAPCRKKLASLNLRRTGERIEATA